MLLSFGLLAIDQEIEIACNEDTITFKTEGTARRKLPKQKKRCDLSAVGCYYGCFHRLALPLATIPHAQLDVMGRLLLPGDLPSEKIAQLCILAKTFWYYKINI